MLKLCCIMIKKKAVIQTLCSTTQELAQEIKTKILGPP